MSAELSHEDIRAAAFDRVTRALRRIENAQNELSAACSELCALTGGIRVWTACSKLTDKVHAFWYRVEGFRRGGRYSLDSINIEALNERRETGR